MAPSLGAFWKSPNNKLLEKLSNIKTPEVSFLKLLMAALMPTLVAVTVYVRTLSIAVLLKPFFIQIQSSCHHLQPAPRARLLSLCTVTLESFRVSLSMALRRAGYSDWSIGYMPEGQKNKNTECTSEFKQDSFHVLGKHRLHLLYRLVKRNMHCRAFMSDSMSNAAGIFMAGVYFCNKQLCCYAERNSEFLMSLQFILTKRNDRGWEHFVPAKTIALAGLNPGRASTGCSWW